MTKRAAVRIGMICLASLLFNLMRCMALAADMPCYPPRHAKVPVTIELSYHKARKRLLAAGWQPLRTKPYNTSDTDPDISSGNGLIFWRKYSELEACSGTGSAACSFLFHDVYGNRLRVITEGEELPKTRTHAIVTSLLFVCDHE